MTPTTISKQQRNETLTKLRNKAGDQLFIDFMIDILTENGSGLVYENLPALFEVWIIKRKFKSRPREKLSFWDAISDKR